MIDKYEVLRLLHSKISEKLICHNFEFRPSEIAFDIKRIANIADDYGYIVVGVSILEDRYLINGVSKNMSIQAVVNKAIEQLTVKPRTEICLMNVDGKNVYIIKIHRINEGTALLVDKLDDRLITEFIDRLYNICIKLQGNAKYIKATEDERNDYIRDMLEQYDYVIKDQTRRGLSSSGVSSGEVDIFVEKDKVPFTIIEALNLNSMNKDYLAKHLDKIYTYDTIGNLFNVCLIYAELKDFSSFFEKYCRFIESYTFPYSTISVDENMNYEYSGSEIKMVSTTHNRSGYPTKLYHICVKILSK